MKTKFKLIVFIILSSFWNCKKEVTLSEYKFADKEMVINCQGEDLKLLNEAIYSFEADMKTYFQSTYNPNGNLDLLYSTLLGRSMKDMVIYEELITPHTLEVFHVLKTKSELWDLNSKISKLNYNSPLVKCIAANIQDKDLKTTFNALLDTHSMKPKIFTEPLLTKFRTVASDNYLRAYVTFDLFYAKLFDLIEPRVKERENVDPNLLK